MKTLAGMLTYTICVLLTFCTFFTSSIFAQSVTSLDISSPDKRIVLFIHGQSGKLTYSITFNSNPVIENSSLGLIINANDIVENCGPGKVQYREQFKDVYPTRGVHSMGSCEFTDATKDYNTFRSR